ncbi:hypothetical protein FRC01_009363 [Tulasnella sp. 417]|nr:hypothetical protein FRC01_009363 [Tulasnella sp. 417]
MSTSLVRPPASGTSDTFVIAQNIMRLASSPWSSPTPESLETVLAAYPTHVDREAENLQQRLDAVTEELRLAKLELQIAREETGRAFLALNERLDRLLAGSEGQAPTRLDPDKVVQAEVVSVCAVGGISQTLDSGAVPAVPPPPRETLTLVGRNKAALDESSLEFVERQVRILLNKLTSENFDSVSDQIVHWVNDSESENNGRVLSLIIKLVFEKATEESHWANMYARLCRRIMERISPAIQDDSVKNQAGEPIVGDQLFIKLLASRCQKNFECGWVRGETSQPGGSIGGEPELGLDEDYARGKTKRQRIGLVRFVGELFKLQMLTERAVYGCIKMLLPSDTSLPNLTEAEAESLRQLLTTTVAKPWIFQSAKATWM